MDGNNCTFCNLDQINQQILYSNDYAILLYPRTPINKDHFMIIPKLHIDTFHNLKINQLMDMHKIISILCSSYESNKEFGGYNLLNNNGKHAGQHIKHCHLHIFLRFQDEKISPLDVLAGKNPKQVFTKDQWQNNFDQIKESLLLFPNGSN